MPTATPKPAGPTVQHATFAIDRTFDAPVRAVFHAWADPEAKAKWFHGPKGLWTEIARRLDFRVGGTEHAKGQFAGGPASTFDATYLDIVPDARIVYVYTMHLDAVKISVSLATVAFHPEGGATRLVVTEQGAFLDGYDDAGRREEGTRGLLENLAAALRTQSKEKKA
jgi:uncharacterized protein YndB with AHSA1/START domain